MAHPSQIGSPTATDTSPDRQLNHLWHHHQHNYTVRSTKATSFLTLVTKHIAKNSNDSKSSSKNNKTARIPRQSEHKCQGPEQLRGCARIPKKPNPKIWAKDRGFLKKMTYRHHHLEEPASSGATTLHKLSVADFEKATNNNENID